MRIADRVRGAAAAASFVAIASALAPAAAQDLVVRVYPRVGLFNELQFRNARADPRPADLRAGEAGRWKPYDADGYLARLDGTLRKQFPYHEWEILTTDPNQNGYRTRKVQLVNPFPTGARGGDCVLEFRNPRGQLQPVSYAGAAVASISSHDCRVDEPIRIASNEALEVRLTYVQAGQKVERAGKVPEDYLVVSLGDSYGSGEGNPDAPRESEWCMEWRELFRCRYRALWMDERCHRSAYAATIRAGLGMINNPQQRGAVTIVSLACSGATIANGILGPYKGVLNLGDFRQNNASLGLQRDGGYLEADKKLPDQLQALRELIDQQDPAGRKTTINALSISIGGNDVSFSDGLKDLLLGGPGNKEKLVAQAADVLRQNVRELRKQLPRVASGLRDVLKGYRVNQVLYTEYPDPTRVSLKPEYCDGVPADGLLGSVFGLGGVTMSKDASAMAYNVVVRGLASIVADASRDHGWKAVDGIVDNPELVGRGWCAEAVPSESGAPKRWFRKWDESRRLQGDEKGTMHPTWELHEWIGRRIQILLDANLRANRQASLDDWIRAAELVLLELDPG
jgi:hypothetical protein